MRILQTAIALLFIVGLARAGVEIRDITSVDQFMEIAWGRSDSAIILFTASWKRKKCQEAVKGLTEYAATTDLDGAVAVAATIDAAKFPEIAKNYSLDHFPTAMLFAHEHGGRVVIYNGHSFEPRKIHDFVANTLARHANYRNSQREVDLEKARTADNHPHPSPGKVVEIPNEAVFEKLVRDPAKTVVVAFVASWCTHCHELKPMLQRIAEYFEGDEKILIATFDGDENRQLMEHFRVEGFPTVRVFPKGTHAKKRGLLYRGMREIGAMQNFIQMQNANVPIPGVEYPFEEHELEDR